MGRLLDGMKRIIQNLRVGTISNNSIKINFDHQDEDGNRADHDESLLSYWKEFAAALRHWSEYHSDDKCLSVKIYFM